MTNSAQPPFRYYMRVRFQECDAQHVVFNARYGDYADLACFEFLRQALPRPRDAFDGSFEMQTVKQVTEWKGPARFDDVLEIAVEAVRFGTTSFDLSCKIRRASAGEVNPIVSVTTTYVHVDPRTWTKKAIEPHMREAVAAGARGRITDHAAYFERTDKIASPRA